MEREGDDVVGYWGSDLTYALPVELLHPSKRGFLRGGADAEYGKLVGCNRRGVDVMSLCIHVWHRTPLISRLSGSRMEYCTQCPERRWVDLLRRVEFDPLPVKYSGV